MNTIEKNKIKTIKHLQQKQLTLLECLTESANCENIVNFIFWSKRNHKTDRLSKIAKKLNFKIDEHYDPDIPKNYLVKTQKSAFPTQNELIENKIIEIQVEIENIYGTRESLQIKDPRLDQFERKKVQRRDENMEPCLICLEDFLRGDKMVVLSCDHYFHRGCISKWFDQKASCPKCRKKFFFTDDGFVSTS